MLNSLEAPERVEAVAIEVSRRRRYCAWGISLAMTAVWALAILTTGMGPRVLGSWEPRATMLSYNTCISLFKFFK